MRRNPFFHLSNVLSFSLLKGESGDVDYLFPILLREPGAAEEAYEALYWPLLAHRPFALNWESGGELTLPDLHSKLMRTTIASRLDRHYEGNLVIYEAGERYLFLGMERTLPLDENRRAALALLLFDATDPEGSEEKSFRVEALAHAPSRHLPNVELFQGQVDLGNGPIALRIAVEETDEAALEEIRATTALSINLIGGRMGHERWTGQSAGFVFARNAEPRFGGRDMARLLKAKGGGCLDRGNGAPPALFRVNYEVRLPLAVYERSEADPVLDGGLLSKDGYTLEGILSLAGNSPKEGGFAMDIEAVLPRKKRLVGHLIARYPYLSKDKGGYRELLFLLQGTKERSSALIKILDPEGKITDNDRPEVEVENIDTEANKVRFKIKIGRPSKKAAKRTVYEPTLNEGTENFFLPREGSRRVYSRHGLKVRYFDGEKFKIQENDWSGLFDDDD